MNIIRSNKKSTGNAAAEFCFPIWAEEAGGLTNGSRQFSFGNGATGAINIPAICDGYIKKIFIDAENAGTSVSIDVYVNDVVAGTANFTQATDCVQLPAQINVNEGDAIGFGTNTEVGAWSDVRVGVSYCKKVEDAVCVDELIVNPNETLTTLTANQNNTELTYTDEQGNSNIIPLNHLQQDICVGPFVDETGRSGWQQTGSPTYTANTGTITEMPYTRVGSGLIVAPNCVTDMKIDIDFGNYYRIGRRFRLFSWIDYRILINGAVVLTRTLEQYHYQDERSDTNPDVIEATQTELFEGGYSTYTRNAVPAGATIEVQSQYRINLNGAQTSASWRTVGIGLRSNASAVFVPRNIVTGAL